MTAMERIAALKKKMAAESETGAVSPQPSTQSNAMQRIQALEAKAQAQEQQGQNAAFTHSGLSRDAFDSGARANYGKSHPDSSYANVVRGANTLNVQNTALTDLESRYGLENDVTKKTRIAQQYNDKLDAVKKRYQQYQLDLAGYQLLQQDAQEKTPAAPVSVDKTVIGNQGFYTGGLVLPIESAAQVTRDAAQSAVQQSASKLSGYDSLYAKYKGKKLNSTERNEVFSALQQLSDTVNDTTATTQDRALARGEWEKLRDLDLYSNYLTYPVGKFATGFTQGVAPVAGGILQTVGDVASAVTGNQNTGSKGIAKLEQYFQENPGEAPNINNANDGHYISRTATATGVDTATVQSYLENEKGSFTRDFNENTLGQTLNPTYKKVVGTVAEQIGQQVPGILLTSGASAGKGAGGLVSKLINGEGLKSAVKAALGGNPATVLLGTRAYSQQLHNLARKNKVGVEAYADSLGTGFIEYFTEGLFGVSDANSWKAIFSGATGSPLKTILKDAAKLLLSGAEEGMEEVVADPMERALDKATIDHSIPVFGKGGVFDPQQMLADGAQAFAVALVMGGFASVSGMYSSYRESLDIQQAGEQLNHIIDQYNAASGASIPNVNPNIMTQEQMDTKAAEVISGWADYANRAHTQALTGDTAQTVPQAVQMQSRETTPANAQTSNTGEFNREEAKKTGSDIAPGRNSTDKPLVAANAGVSNGQVQSSEKSADTASNNNEPQPSEDINKKVTTGRSGENIIKTDNGDGANQTSLAANGDAGTQSLLSTDNVAQSDEKINGKNVDTPGDAPKGFDPLSRMQGEKNATQMHSVNEQAAERTQEERRRAPSDIPKENLEGHLTSKHAATLANTPVTTNEMSAAIERELANGNFSRMAYTDEAAQKKTDAHIRRVGWDAALAEYKVAVKDGKSSKDIVSLGQTLYNNFVNSGDVMGAMDIASLMISNAKETAQALQAMNMINKATPESRLYMVAQSVENMQQKLEEKYGDRAPDLKIDKDLLKNYYDALKTTDKAAQTDAWHAVEQNIADQIPATWKDKLNAWRYLAMLGNPRTHIRNIAGNAGFMPVRMIKDAVAAGIENAANIEGRTKAILNPVNTSDRSLLQFGWSDYDGVVDQIQSGGKFVDTSGEIENMRTIFGIKPLESTRKFNTFALDLEDTWFSRPAYAGALAGWLKANGCSTQDILNGTITDSRLSEARSYAIKEAQKATYRDSNDFSDAVARMGRNYTGNSKTGKVANVLLEGVLPFKRTPANILVRGVEYSPVGLVKGIYDMTTKVKGGEVSAAQAIDEFSSGLTGTGLLALGMLLAKLGLASGSADDDKDKENFEKLRGGQDYALTIGNKSFTIDWLAPEALPFFMGIEVHRFLADSDGYTPHEAMESLKNLSEPILETSMLSSLEDILSNIKYADGDYLGTIASTAVTSYLSQFLPTLAGQAERSLTEKNRMETFRYGDTDTLGTGGAYGLGQALNKVPGVDYGQIPYIDAWGRTQDQGGIVGRVLNNFLNPSYVSGDRSESVDQELQRLYDAGNAGVLPKRAAQSTKIDGSYLTQGEYVKYNQTKGKTALDLVSDFIGGNAYKGLTDKERAAVIRDIYTYAGDRAKKAVVQSRGETYESEWDDESGLKDLPDYLAVKDTFSAASKARDYQTIDGLSHKYSALSDKAKTVLDNSFGRLDQIAEAHDSGIDSEQWYAAYDMWKDLYDTKRSGYSAMDKATDFAAWVDKTGLSAQQRDLLKGQLAFSSGYKVSADKYEAFTKAGLTTDTAVNVYDTISSLAPAAGKNTVSSKQKFAAISNMDNLSDGQKLLAMFGLDTDSDSTYEKYNAASEAGIPLSGWAEFTSKLDSSVSQGDLQTAINTMPWSRAQKAAAWRAYSDAKHWKAANPWG